MTCLKYKGITWTMYYRISNIFCKIKVASAFLISNDKLSLKQQTC